MELREIKTGRCREENAEGDVYEQGRSGKFRFLWRRHDESQDGVYYETRSSTENYTSKGRLLQQH